MEDTSNYRLETPHGCVARLCALCCEPIALDPGVYTAMQIEQRITAHHAVCPKRPIEVGERVRVVRIVNGVAPELAGETGTIDKIDESDVPYRVALDQNREWKVWCHEVERIPRPAEAQAPGIYARWWPRGRSDERRYADGDMVAGILTIKHLGPTWSSVDGFVGECVSPDVLGGAVAFIDRPRTARSCAPGCQCGAHETAATRVAQTVHPAVKDAGRYSEPPAPALVDGLDREVCLARWMENRLFCEGKHGSAVTLPNSLTPAQIATGRALWLERFGAVRGDELRALLAADREAARNRVRVDIQDVD